MASGMENIEKLCANLEELELDGSANAEIYTQLLAIYLLQPDICNAKFLWKRIPDDIKAVRAHIKCIFCLHEIQHEADLGYIFESAKDIQNAYNVDRNMKKYLPKSCPELSKLWTLGCHMWKRDYHSIYSSLQQDWSPLIQTYIVALKEKLQEKAFNLIANAYTSIKADDFAVYMGMPRESAIEVAKSRGWTLDANTMLLNPKKPDTVAKEIPLTSEQELGLLTDYVSFLEN